jgi:hypothetical protein
VALSINFRPDDGILTFASLCRLLLLLLLLQSAAKMVLAFFPMHHIVGSRDWAAKVSKIKDMIFMPLSSDGSNF